MKQNERKFKWTHQHNNNNKRRQRRRVGRLQQSSTNCKNNNNKTIISNNNNKNVVLRKKLGFTFYVYLLSWLYNKTNNDNQETPVKNHSKKFSFRSRSRRRFVEIGVKSRGSLCAVGMPVSVLRAQPFSRDSI